MRKKIPFINLSHSFIPLWLGKKSKEQIHFLRDSNNEITWKLFPGNVVGSVIQLFCTNVDREWDISENCSLLVPATQEYSIHLGVTSSETEDTAHLLFVLTKRNRDRWIGRQTDRQTDFISHRTINSTVSFLFYEPSVIKLKSRQVESVCLWEGPRWWGCSFGCL